jgi:hypothetical protein
LSDVFQSPEVAYATAAFISAVPILLAAGLRVPAIKQLLVEQFPSVSEGFPIRSFGVSCFLISALIAGFASLSSRLDDNGGVIASAFPEIQALQRSLGVIEEKVTAVDERTQRIEKATTDLKNQSDFLVDASGKWLGVTDIHLFKNQNSINTDIRFGNESAFIFDRVTFFVADATRPNQKLVHEKDIIVVPNTKEMFLSELKEIPERFLVCVHGQRRSDGVWTKETRVYGNPRVVHPTYVYRIVETSGVQRSSEKDKC